jgi:hypothetical protein
MPGRPDPPATPQQHRAAYDDVDADDPGERHDVAARAGTDSYLAGDTDAAHTWFQRATRHALEHADELLERADGQGAVGRDAAAAYVDALVAAGLSGEENLVTDAASRVYAGGDALEAAAPTAAFLESQVLATAMLDDEDVHALATMLVVDDDVSSASALPPGYDRPLATACRGLVARETDPVEVGVSDLLAAHAEVDGGAICRPAATLLALARRRGLDVSVEDAAVPDVVTDSIGP